MVDCTRQKVGPMIALLTILLSSPVLGAREPPIVRLARQSKGGWVCNAYGYERQWKTVAGIHKNARKEAKKSALLECSKLLTTCRLSGCWQD
jgi:hypothetical protein